MKINLNEVSDFYNNTNEIWSKKDKWHFKTYLVIKQFIKEHIVVNHKTKILNAGSGGNSYEINDSKMTHMDIAFKLIESKKMKILGSIEAIPCCNNSFTDIICVGSVINYCDPIKVIKEFKRVLKNGGNLILEYENSKSLELLFTKNFNKKVVFKKTFYNNKQISLWYFSEEYINKILILNDFKILSTKRFHTISALIYRITKNENFSSKFLIYDWLFRKIPILKNYSSNVILTAKLNITNPN